MNLIHLKEMLRYVIIKMVSPSTVITFNLVYHSCLFTGIFTGTDTETDTETDMGTDMDTLTKVLDHGHDYSEGFDSAEFALLTTANGF